MDKLKHYATLELGPKYAASFNRISLLSAKYIVSISVLFYYGLIIVYTGVMIILYIKYYHDASLIIYLFWIATTYYGGRAMCAIYLTALYFVFIMSAYLTLRFRQIYWPINRKDIKGIKKT